MIESFVNWVDSEIAFLQGQIELLGNKKCVEVDVFIYFKNSFNSDVYLKELTHSLATKDQLDNLDRFIDIIKKPYSEVKKYPIDEKPSERTEWFGALAELLELSTIKLLKFSLKEVRKGESNKQCWEHKGE